MYDRLTHGVRIGVADIGPTVVWQDLKSEGFQSPVTRQALPAGLRFVRLDAANFSTTDTFWLQFKAGDGEATTHALRFPPSSHTDDIRIWPEGQAVTVISHRSDNTVPGDGQLVGYFVDGDA